jgi:SP family sugar:H+ symporter-like MFS transporter
MAFCTLIFTFFFVPECTGKSLEEVDLMFHERVPLRQFQSYKADEKLETAIQKEKDVVESVREF